MYGISQEPNFTLLHINISFFLMPFIEETLPIVCTDLGIQRLREGLGRSCLSFLLVTVGM